MDDWTKRDEEETEGEKKVLKKDELREDRDRVTVGRRMKERDRIRTVQKEREGTPKERRKKREQRATTGSHKVTKFRRI